MTLKPGDAIASREFPPITQDRLRDYAEASGDPNPIHLDEKVARSMGLPGVIAHGMLVAGFVAETARASAGNGRVTRFQIRFKGMTFLGDTLRVGGRVKSVSSAGAITLELDARDARGDVKATATADLTGV